MLDITVIIITIIKGVQKINRVDLMSKLVDKEITKSVEWVEKNDLKSYGWVMNDYLMQVLERDTDDDSAIEISFMKSGVNLLFTNAGFIYWIINSDWDQWENERLELYYNELNK